MLVHLSKRVLPAAALALVALVAVLPSGATSGATAPSGQADCRRSFLPVTLEPGQPADNRVAVKLCIPRRTDGRVPTTVQFLVHGCLYNGRYWDFPDPTGGTDRYSYVRSAWRAGYATLTFDMVGTGASSHPASTELTVERGAYVLHQLVVALRRGKIPAVRPTAFTKVIEVSHSFGTFFAWRQVSRYHDVDAAIFTGATHHLRFNLPFLSALLSFRPASLDPEFSDAGLDPGYLTTNPGSRGVFYQPAAVDPAVVAFDEAHKDAFTVSEFTGFPPTLATPLDVRVPVLVALGGKDPMFCDPATATDCSSASALLAQERSFLGPRIPRAEAYLLPGSGHNLNLMPNAPVWFAAAQAWARRTVGPGLR